jgi:CubicO group peptidase (beta-lactamase class C family)
MLYERCAGFRDAAEKLPIDPDTMFGLASITKSFTALSVMQLWAGGRVDPAAPVTRYLPYFDARGASLSAFLCHSAGYFPLPRLLVGDVASEMGLSAEAGDLAYHTGLQAEGARRVAARLDAQTAFTGRVGQRFSYCNDGFAMLSALVAEVGDQPTYAEYLDAHVLAPLGMTRSGCGFQQHEKHDNVSRLYQYKDGAHTVTDDFTDNAFVLMGGGNMKSTLRDMQRYVHFYLSRGCAPDGQRLIPGYFVDEMTRPRIMTGINTAYGYGLQSQPLGDIRTIRHGGSLTGVSTHMAFSYEADLGVVVLCNTSGVQVGLVCDALFETLTGQQVRLPEPLPETAWDDAALDAVCGAYVSGEGARVEIARDGAALRVDFSGESRRAAPVNAYTLQMDWPLAPMRAGVIRHDDGSVLGLALGSRIIPREG